MNTQDAMKQYHQTISYKSPYQRLRTDSHIQLELTRCKYFIRRKLTMGNIRAYRIEPPIRKEQANLFVGNDSYYIK